MRIGFLISKAFKTSKSHEINVKKPACVLRVKNPKYRPSLLFDIKRIKAPMLCSATREKKSVKKSGFS
jgi:hypothetical protein